MRRVLVALFCGLALVAAFFLFRGSTRPEPVVSKAPVAPSREVARAPAPTRPAAPTEPEAPAAVRAPRRPAKPTPEAAPVAAPAAPEAPKAPSPDLGQLTITVDVPGAQVFLDRVFLGASPATAANVAPGAHRLNVSAAGWDGVSETLEVTAGPRDVVVKLKEVRLDARLDVVHKHRFGSCKGRLVATPQGLRYETTDKDDAFVAGLLDLDGFEVNYLEKDLRVQVKKGKKYDFTDPDGNADRLFVFHRDVDKARERLKRGDPPAAP